MYLQVSTRQKISALSWKVQDNIPTLFAKFYLCMLGLAEVSISARCKLKTRWEIHCNSEVPHYSLFFLLLDFCHAILAVHLLWWQKIVCHLFLFPDSNILGVFGGRESLLSLLYVCLILSVLKRVCIVRNKASGILLLCITSYFACFSCRLQNTSPLKNSSIGRRWEKNWAFLTQLVDRWFVLRIKRVSDADFVVFFFPGVFLQGGKAWGTSLIIAPWESKNHANEWFTPKIIFVGEFFLTNLLKARSGHKVTEVWKLISIYAACGFTR